MATAWKKVLVTGRVASTDLATEGSAGQVLTTNGSGALSYSSKTVDTNTNQLTTWSMTDGTNAGEVAQGELITVAGSGATSVAMGGTGNRTLTVTSTDNNDNTNTLTVFQLLANGADSSDVSHGTDVDIIGAGATTVTKSGTAITITSTDTTTTDDDVSVSNLETRLGEIDTNVTIGSATNISTTISGNLIVSGTTTTIDSTTLQIDDDFISVGLSSGDNDGGITVFNSASGSLAHLGYDQSETRWSTNIGASPAMGTHFVPTIQVSATDATPTNGTDAGSGVGSFWINNMDVASGGASDLYIRVTDTEAS